MTGQQRKHPHVAGWALALGLWLAGCATVPKSAPTSSTPPESPEAARAELGRLEREIAASRVQLGLAPRGEAAGEDAARERAEQPPREAEPAAPLAEQPQQLEATDEQRPACRHARAICHAAQRICELAEYLADDDARQRCARAREDCAAARQAGGC